MAGLSNQVPGLDWSAISAVIFDVDGTLYHQAPLRNRMRLRLVTQLYWQPWRWKELRVIRSYRRIREKLSDEGASPITKLQYETCARELDLGAEQVRGIIEYWMKKAPLPYLAACRAPGIRRLWETLTAHGLLIAVVSDYAAEAKLQALGLACPVVVSAEDPQVEVLKPNPKGFLQAAKLLGKSPAECLVFGDRLERDGEAAKRAGMDFLQYAPHGPKGPKKIASYLELIA